MFYFSGYAAIFNIPDNENDIILPGAFRNIRPKIFLCLEHNIKNEIGRIIKISQNDYGLHVEGIFDINPKRDGLSIGFYTKKKHNENDFKIISEIDLIEISVVAFPLHQQARIITIQSTT